MDQAEVRERYFGRGNSLGKRMEASKCLTVHYQNQMGAGGEGEGLPLAFLFDAFSLEVGTVSTTNEQIP